MNISVDRMRRYGGRYLRRDPSWERLRLTILERDQHLCQTCRREGRLTACNIVTRIGDDDLEAICGEHHRAKANGHS